VLTPAWTVILAAGAGRRLSSVTDSVPKQFWRGARGASLLDQTIERFLPLVPRSRTLVIVDAGHRDHVNAWGGSASLGRLVVQPEDRGTAAGVLLALTPILESAPDAVVAITPSDHGVVNAEAFRRGISEAARQVAVHEDIVLCGVVPTAAQEDYGWISVGSTPASTSLPRVQSFVEKPPADVAARLFESGAVWNTMITVARASAIRQLYAELLPDLAAFFGAVAGLSDRERSVFLTDVYPMIPRFDFSRDLLTHARSLSAYVWPASIGWSDLGTPERLSEWHRRTGSRTADEGHFAAPQPHLVAL
jgi:mannose-1-phosphate guanylyltransferase